MSSQSTTGRKSPGVRKNLNKGLTKAGVVVIQTLVIGFFTSLEIFLRRSTGVITGIAICVAVLGTIRFARAGTEYVAATTGPLAFAVSSLISLIAVDGLHPTKLGIDIVASLASAAPYLLFSVALAWLNYFRNRKKVH